MKKLLLLAAFLCAALYSSGQSYTIKGTVLDTLNSNKLYRASVVLIRTKDSVIQSYTRTSSDGKFEIHAPAKGKYLLRVSFPSFVDFLQVLDVNSPITDLGDMPMLTKEHLLQEFVVTRQIAAIKIKGDTTEYMADSFKVKEGANVEDLLKRLPGITVDKNGQITAQGETVQKILVDGEEFFADDPKVVTKGLQANAVEKVQVYDKKSDQAEFTGVDDGQKTKTINLELKEEKKKGYFGKIDAGGGTDGYYQNQAMINAFKGKRQLAAFGIVSSTDKVGLGWQDNGKFGGGNDFVYDDGDQYILLGNNDEDFGGWNGSYGGEGLPRVWTGGVHYADRWNEDKDHVTGNYRYAKQNVEATGDNTTQYILTGDSSNVKIEHKQQSSWADRHAADFMYEWKIDSNNSIKITAGAGTKTTDVFSNYQTQTSLLTHNTESSLYRNSRTITSHSMADYLNGDLLFKRKFAKKGRTLSLDLKGNDRNSSSNGHLNSVIQPDTVNAVNSVVDQQKTNSTETVVFAGKAIYTEPLSKTTNLEFNYGITQNNTMTANYSYNSDGTGHYTSLDSVFSSHYKYDILSNSGGLSLHFTNKKINFAIGSDVSNTNYLQTNLFYKDSALQHDYFNISPKANFKYSISKQRSIRFSYQGTTKPPLLSQVQPLRQNTDPTNITIGNPNLKQAFEHRLSLNFNDYKVLTDRWIYAGLNGGFTNNAISTSQNTREGINTTQYINVNGDYSLSSWMGIGVKLKKINMNISADFGTSISHSINYVNGAENIYNNNSYSPSIRFSKYKEDKYDFSFSPGVTYNDNKSTIGTSAPSYWSGTAELEGSVKLPKSFEVGTDANLMIRQATIAFPDHNQIIKWNAFAAKKFLKKKELELRFTAYDILNQNIGFTRSAQGSIITQNNYSTIRRYFMLSIIWNFTHTPGAEPVKN